MERAWPGCPRRSQRPPWPRRSPRSRRLAPRRPAPRLSPSPAILPSVPDVAGRSGVCPNACRRARLRSRAQAWPTHPPRIPSWSRYPSNHLCQLADLPLLPFLDGCHHPPVTAFDRLSRLAGGGRDFRRNEHAHAAVVMPLLDPGFQHCALGGFGLSDLNQNLVLLVLEFLREITCGVRHDAVRVGVGVEWIQRGVFGHELPDVAE